MLRFWLQSDYWPKLITLMTAMTIYCLSTALSLWWL